MTVKQPKHLIIVGGGTAGWMTAAALSRFIPSHWRITLVASAEIGTVGVGEATIPHIRKFNELIGVDENTFIKAVGATYKLAIRFVGWGDEQSDYCHPFGFSGDAINDIEFHHYYLKAGGKAVCGPYDDFAIAAKAARAGRFDYPKGDSTQATGQYGYAFHMDATAYSQFLRDLSMQRGVTHRDAKIVAINTHTNGAIASLQLADGETLSGDWFVDCSGFRGLLIEQTLASGYENWQHWLPCDRALAVPSQAMASPPSYTLAKAHESGWRWQIPLQHRTGNGLVYCSEFMTDEQAQDNLLTALGDTTTDTPRSLAFVTGKRHQSWLHNCVAIGLSSGFLEPLESTSLYLIQMAIEKFIALFPQNGPNDILAREFNRVIDTEYEKVRDFLILHYALNQRSEPFWQQCANMSLPDSLQQRIDAFRQTAHLLPYRQGLFMPVSWVAVCLGQGLLPDKIDPRVGNLDPTRVAQQLSHYKTHLHQQVMAMPEHASVIGQPSRYGAPPLSSASLYGRAR